MELPDWIGEKKLFLIAIVAVIATIIGIAYAANALAVYKPSIFQLEVKELPVAILSITTNYDPETDRYTSMIVTIKNNAVEQLSNIKIAVYFYSNNTLIASGTSPTFTLNPAQQATIPIQLEWVNDYNVLNCTSGKLVVYP